VYSINYWGLSVYYWYLFGGLAIAVGRQIQRKLGESAEFKASSSRGPQLAKSMRRPVAVNSGLAGRRP
jgi:putative inorganic carbon (HCO3(-)) transporter